MTFGSERAKNGLRARYKSGLISGKPPIGYKFEVGYAVKECRDMGSGKVSLGNNGFRKQSLSQIAKIMTDSGLREIHGKRAFKIRMQTASRIFRQKFYAGILTSKTYPDEVRDSMFL